MIPIRDTIPCHCRPVITWALIAVNGTIFLVTELMPQQTRHVFIYYYGLVAARYSYPEWARQSGFPDDHYLSFFTSMFLHGGWLHVVMNLWFLWIFGDNIEDRMGRVRFLVFYVTCGLIGSFLQYYFNPDSTIPVVGASGAIAGVMGAYFFLYPYARIVIWVPLFFIPLFFNIPAIAFLGVWVIIQMHEATQTLIGNDSSSNIAWWGHMGGFMSGLILHQLFLHREDSKKIPPGRE